MTQSLHVVAQLLVAQQVSTNLLVVTAKLCQQLHAIKLLVQIATQNNLLFSSKNNNAHNSE